MKLRGKNCYCLEDSIQVSKFTIVLRKAPQTYPPFTPPYVLSVKMCAKDAGGGGIIAKNICFHRLPNGWPNCKPSELNGSFLDIETLKLTTKHCMRYTVYIFKEREKTNIGVM